MPGRRMAETLLVAREAEAAETSAARLRGMGQDALALPLARIAFAGNAPDLIHVQALAFTSRNGALAFAALSPRRDVRAFAVGPATAEALREAGFQQVEEGPSDGAALAEKLAAALDPAAGHILHVSGDRVAFDIAAALVDRGFSAARAEVYRTEAVSGIPDQVRSALAQEQIAGVLLYSAAGVCGFHGLLQRAGFAGAALSLRVWCLSMAVAKQAADLGFQRVRAARTPREPDLFALAMTEART